MELSIANEVVVNNIGRIVVILIKCTKWDSDGYLVQFARGVLPCNSLAVLTSLTEAALDQFEAKGIATDMQVFDETVGGNRILPEKIMAEYQDAKVIVGFVGVQTNQFPRARQLALAFTKLGATAVIGGFHVSGSITMLHDGVKDRRNIPHVGIMPPECQELMDNGIIIFHGEAEDSWQQVLEDIYRGKPKLLYRGGRPDLSKSPLPHYPPGYFDKYFGLMTTFDTGRGCPFVCSFCSIINVQGNEMRSRSPEAIVAQVKELCIKHGKLLFFFTDDNFARSKHWEDILLLLIDLKKQGYTFNFMIEADLPAWKLIGKKTGIGFPELLAEAGCFQVFLGVESLNPETLKHASKRQNTTAEYPTMCARYTANGITAHASYIVGFPEDTPESIHASVRELKNIGFDFASFFILSPVPGSEDHVRQRLAGVWMDTDFNNYDSFQPVTMHAKMTRAELMKAYLGTWKEFFSLKLAVRTLRRAKTQWFILARLIFWYRLCAIGEPIHPMIGGIYRIKRFADRRDTAKPLSFSKHIIKEIIRNIRFCLVLAREIGFITLAFLIAQTQEMFRTPVKS